MAKRLYPGEHIHHLLDHQSLEVQLIVRGKRHEFELPHPAAYSTRQGFERALGGVLNLTPADLIHCPGMITFINTLWAQGMKIKLEERLAKEERKVRLARKKEKRKQRELANAAFDAVFTRRGTG